MTTINPAGIKIDNKLEEFLSQVKLEEILYTKFATQLADQGFSKAEIDMNENSVKARLIQYVQDKYNPRKRDDSKPFEFSDPNQIFAEFIKGQQTPTRPGIEREPGMGNNNPPPVEGEGSAGKPFQFSDPETVFAEFLQEQGQQGAAGAGNAKSR